MNIGTKIKGKYLGKFDIIGEVIGIRDITVPTDGCWSHTIKLIEPIRVYGSLRDIVVMNTLYDGSPSSYTHFTDVMKKII